MAKGCGSHFDSSPWEHGRQRTPYNFALLWAGWKNYGVTTIPQNIPPQEGPLGPKIVQISRVGTC